MKYGYIAIYGGRRIEIEGEELTLYEAKKQAIIRLNIPKSKTHMLVIGLAEKDGQPVVHTPDY